MGAMGRRAVCPPESTLHLLLHRSNSMLQRRARSDTRDVRTCPRQSREHRADKTIRLSDACVPPPGSDTAAAPPRASVTIWEWRRWWVAPLWAEGCTSPPA
ncbi:Uncharacterized protein DAT39_016956 [Clarias magur]|uniref:Uncharacterized protein n=1 Tax=Clarias magur TaxID=1594786 RepID=A0A8J4TDT0_CLAMG|nr:Uncharacterized protein DAT39_016956 [Clarias magur]